ncbi:MAG TPA: hypothetical protein VE378_05705 [Nitrososphaeraceae archaeon]|nr:hypothetical protein [Nitrososphaeraceae archaeon]
MVKTIIAISLLSIITATMALQIQSGDASTGNTTGFVKFIRKPKATEDLVNHVATILG